MNCVSVQSQVLLEFAREGDLQFVLSTPRRRRVCQHEPHGLLHRELKQENVFKAEFRIDRPAPKELKHIYELSLIRCGVSQSPLLLGQLTLGGAAKEVDTLDPKETAVPVSYFSIGKDDNGESFLKFKLQGRDREPTDVNLWYDPKTYTPLRRAGNGSTETYTDFVFDGNVPDEKFRLPEDK